MTTCVYQSSRSQCALRIVLLKTLKTRLCIARVLVSITVPEVILVRHHLVARVLVIVLLLGVDSLEQSIAFQW